MMRKYTPSILNHDFEHMFIEFVGRICSKLWLFTYDYPQIWLWTNTRIPWTWKQLVVILGSHPHKINVFHSSWFIFRGFSSGQCIEILDLEPLKKWVNTCLPSPNPLDTWLCNQRACAESIDMHPIHAHDCTCIYVFMYLSKMSQKPTKNLPTNVIQDTSHRSSPQSPRRLQFTRKRWPNSYPVDSSLLPNYDHKISKPKADPKIFEI